MRSHHCIPLFSAFGGRARIVVYNVYQDDRVSCIQAVCRSAHFACTEGQAARVARKSGRDVWGGGIFGGTRTDGEEWCENPRFWRTFFVDCPIANE